MGWSHDDLPTHEGYIVGVVALEGSSYRTRELGSIDNDADQPVERIQVACSCGWRSAIVNAPLGTRFSPSIVIFPSGTTEQRTEDRALLEWNTHIDRERGRYAGRWFLREHLSWLHEAYCFECNGRGKILSQGTPRKMIDCFRCEGTGKQQEKCNP